MKRLHKAIKVISEGGKFKGARLYTAAGEPVPGIGKATAAKWAHIEQRMEWKYQEIVARNLKKARLAE